MKKLLWLDDIRDPKDNMWHNWLATREVNPFHYDITWVTNYNDFVAWIKSNGLPDVICFDHDLGEDVARERVSNGMSKRQARIKKRETKSGHEAAKWLVDYCIDKDLDLPTWRIQSANPVGAENINSLLTNYAKFRG
jgi:hypothetical protein